MELERKITKSDDESTVKTSNVRLTFNDQKLLDLWNNELCGQFSDGLWGNSKGTEWLWVNSSAVLGKENKLLVQNLYLVKRKSYPFFQNLFNIVGDRMMVENGFENEKELKKACKIIQDIIKNYLSDDSIYKEIKAEENRIKLEKENRIISFLERIKDYTFTKKYEWNPYLLKINNFEVEILSVDENNIITIQVYGKEFNYTKFKLSIKENDFDKTIKAITELANLNQRG